MSGWLKCFGAISFTARSPLHCPPPGSRLTAAADVYSFGVVMLEMVTAGRRPFGAVPADRIARLVMMGTRPVFPAWVPHQYRYECRTYDRRDGLSS
jgi:hypothetical protein